MELWRSLFMHCLKPTWDEHYVKKAFMEYGFTPVHVKFVKGSASHKILSNHLTHAFVDFETFEIAMTALRRCIGQSVGGTGSRFLLSLSRDSRCTDVINEYSLFIQNLAQEVSDKELFELFSEYPSCVGAKVAYEREKVSRTFGFVRFASDEERKKAAEEKDMSFLCGKKVQVRMAKTIIRNAPNPEWVDDDREISKKLNALGCKSPIRKPLLPLPSAPSRKIPLMRIPLIRKHSPTRSRSRSPFRSQEPLAEIVYETADESNAKIMSAGEEWWEELENSRWSSVLTHSEMKVEQISFMLEQGEKMKFMRASG